MLLSGLEFGGTTALREVAQQREVDARPGTAPAVLGVRHLSKSFGPVTALRNVSLDISPGEIHGICGENGAGKSTLVKILTGVYRPDAGNIFVNSAVVSIATPRQAQEQGIAIVAQELSLCPDLSVEDNIWLGSLRVPFLHKRPELRRRAAEALNLLGAGYIALDAPAARRNRPAAHARRTRPHSRRADGDAYGC
jgi:ribose transport system ATP-binding protein